jgi:hypothetical protein
MGSMQPPDKQKAENWLSSKEAKKALKVSDCHLMHMRLAGKLQFRKEGNRFFYLIPKQPEK